MKIHFIKSIPLVAVLAITFFLVSPSNAAEVTPAPAASPTASAPSRPPAPTPGSPLKSSATHPTPPLDAPARTRNPLVWDAMEKTIAPSSGETNVHFTFWVTNTSAIADVIINQLSPSCDCTVPSTKVPWRIAPGANGPMKATVDITGKSGELTKTIAIVSTAGSQTLTLKINVPAVAANAAPASANNSVKSAPSAKADAPSKAP